MSTDLSDEMIELIAGAVEAAPGLELRSVEGGSWERRSAQVWYRVEARLVPDAPNQVQVDAGLVVPLIDRMLQDPEPTLSVGGNLLRLSGSHATSFDLQPAGRRGKIVARLRAPVFGSSGTHAVTEGQPFADELTQLLTASFTPLVELTTWEHLADHLRAHGSDLAAKGAGPADFQGREGILRWATGHQDAGTRLIRAGFEASLAQAVLARLAERFRPVAAL